MVISSGLVVIFNASTLLTCIFWVFSFPALSAASAFHVTKAFWLPLVELIPQLHCAAFGFLLQQAAGSEASNSGSGFFIWHFSSHI